MSNNDYWPDHVTGWTLVERYTSNNNPVDSKQAFNQLYTLYKRGLYTYLFRKGCNETVADDVYQITWEKIIRIRAQLKHLAITQLAATDEQQKFNFTSYLYTITRNKYYDYLRQQKSGANYTHEHDDSAEPNPEAEAEKENAEEVQLALDHVATQMHIGVQHIKSLDYLPENLEPGADFEQQPERQIELQELARLLGEGIALLPRHQQDAFLLRRMGLSLDMIAKIQEVPRETVRSRLKAAMKALKKVLEKWRTV